MRHFIIAIAVAVSLGLVASTYAGGGGQGGMRPGTSKGSQGDPTTKDLGSSSQGLSQGSSSEGITSSPSKKKSSESSLGVEKDQGLQKEQQQGMQKEQKDSPPIQGSAGPTEGRGDRFGESGSGQGSGGGIASTSGAMGSK